MVYLVINHQILKDCNFLQPELVKTQDLYHLWNVQG